MRRQDADQRYSARDIGQSRCYLRPSSPKRQQGSSIVLQLLAAGCSNILQPLRTRHRHRRTRMYSRHLKRTGARRVPMQRPRLLAGQTASCSGTMRLSHTA